MESQLTILIYSVLVGSHTNQARAYDIHSPYVKAEIDTVNNSFPGQGMNFTDGTVYGVLGKYLLLPKRFLGVALLRNVKHRGLRTFWSLRSTPPEVGHLASCSEPQTLLLRY